MKRPSFQFYPADWRKDMALQSCSVAARGQHAALMHAMVLGVSLDGRRRAGQKVEAVA